MARYKQALPQVVRSHGVYFVTFVTWQRLELDFASREIVLQSCLHFHEKRYFLYLVVIMNDHVHFMIRPFQREQSQQFWTLGQILHSIKGYSAKQIPSVTKHIGKVWQDGRYDRLIRDRREFENTWEYIRQNPVKAGFSPTPEAYPFLWESHPHPERATHHL